MKIEGGGWQPVESGVVDFGGVKVSVNGIGINPIVFAGESWLKFMAGEKDPFPVVLEVSPFKPEVNIIVNRVNGNFGFNPLDDFLTASVYRGWGSDGLLRPLIDVGILRVPGSWYHGLRPEVSDSFNEMLEKTNWPGWRGCRDEETLVVSYEFGGRAVELQDGQAVELQVEVGKTNNGMLEVVKIGVPAGGLRVSGDWFKGKRECELPGYVWHRPRRY